MNHLLRTTLLFATATLSATSRCDAQCDLQATPGLELPGVSGTVRALAEWDPDGAGPATPLLVVGGSFRWAGDIAATDLAAFDPVTREWSTIGSFAFDDVGSICVLPTGELVVAGGFLHRIVYWDGSQWSPLGGGLSGIVDDVAPIAGGLMAVGAFWEQGGPTIGVGRWDWSTGWTSDTSTRGYALEVVPNGDVIAMGNFLAIGAIGARRIARWNGTSWSSLGHGLDAAAFAATALANGDIVVAGHFSVAGTAAANRVARWNGSYWTGLGAGIGPYVTDVLAMPNGDIVATGTFDNAGGMPALGLARWNGAAWSAFGTGLDRAGSGECLEKLSNGDLVVGGQFRSADGVAANSVAFWDGTTWSATKPGTNATAWTLTELPDGGVLACGSFDSIQGWPVHRVARRTGNGWTQLGTGVDGSVFAATVLANGDIVVGGSLLTVGSTTVDNVARWDGTTWSPMGGGVDGTVRSLATLPNGDVVASGFFNTAGGVSAEHIARWDGTAWHALGSGCDAVVHSVAVLPDGSVVAGGAFDMAGGMPANRVARWDGSAWGPLGSGLDSAPFTMKVHPDGRLIVGGTFSTAGGNPAHRVASWDGSTWSQLGTPSLDTILDFDFLPDGDIVAAGSGPFSGSLIRWDGTTWSDLLASPPDNSVSSVLVTRSGTVLVSGSFRMIGNELSVHFAELTTPCPAAAAPYGAGCTGLGGANTLTAGALPWIGATATSTATGMAPNSLAIEVLGFAPLSLPLASVLPQGAPGCTLHVDPVVLAQRLTGAGSIDVELSIPPTAALVGASVRQQLASIELDANGHIAALTSTNALQLTIGRF